MMLNVSVVLTTLHWPELKSYSTNNIDVISTWLLFMAEALQNFQVHIGNKQQYEFNSNIDADIIV